MRGAIVSAVFCSLMAAGTVSAQQSQPGGMGGGMMGDQGMMGPSTGGAGPSQGMMGQYGYGRIDRNGDGVIAKEEVREHQRLLERIQANWDQADRNKDGQVDTAEFAAFEQEMQK